MTILQFVLRQGRDWSGEQKFDFKEEEVRPLLGGGGLGDQGTLLGLGMVTALAD